MRILLDGASNVLKSTKFQDRLAAFGRGEWAQLVDSLDWSHLEPQSATTRRQREEKDEMSRRTERAVGFVQALEDARLAPGTGQTLLVLRDPKKRPPLP